MKQSTLLDFWKSPVCESHTQEKPPILSAKESLSKHFQRTVPDDIRYHTRLEEEYALIDKNSFTHVFLQVQTILECIETIGRETGKPIPHIIRGSAGSSLVCYCLGITHIDPIAYGIELARFMNDCRQDIPDIDIDVPYNRREEIYERIAQTWKHQVARVSNTVRWKLKSALRDSIQTILKEKDPSEETKHALQRVRRKQFQLAQCLPQADDQEKAMRATKERVGTVRTLSKHCGGIVIFENEGAVPSDAIHKMIQANRTPIAQLKQNKDEVEEAGWIKIDVLSNRGLAQLADICPTRPLTSYPARDNQTERIFAKGNTIGITFGESRGMRKIFMEMCPQNVKEIAVGLALIRPAAAAEGRKQAFLEKWKLPKHDDGLGVLCRPIIFDDDAIKKVRLALQCSSAEADWWRKAFAKGNRNAKMSFRDALSLRGYDRVIQDSIIEDLEQLIYYSFCKSHAISYAQLVWALAYWKAHHPHAFWCATLNHCNSEFRKWVHYREAKISGLGLSREQPPYQLGHRNGMPVLQPIRTSEQTLLTDEETPQQIIRDMKQCGYWLTESFFPSCGIWPHAQQRLDGKRMVRFRGLIATGRTVQRNGSKCTLLCIGVDNGVYMDIVLSDQLRGDLFRWVVVEGSGIQRADSQSTIDVQTIRGVSLKHCV